MTKLIVTRHKALVEWLSLRGIEGEVRGHLELEYISNQDEYGNIAPGYTCTLVLQGIKEVWGVLPLPLIAELNKIGIKVMTVALDIPADLRGKELSLRDMSRIPVTVNETLAVLTPVKMADPKPAKDLGDPEIATFEEFIADLEDAGWERINPTRGAIIEWMGPGRHTAADVAKYEDRVETGDLVFMDRDNDRESGPRSVMAWAKWMYEWGRYKHKEDQS